MKKLQLAGLGHREGRLYFKIKKEKNIRSFLAYFLLKCGFDDNLYLTDYETEKKDVSLFEDLEENYTNGYFDIDLFFGHKNLIIIIRSKNKKNEAFARELVKEHCEVKK